MNSLDNLKSHRIPTDLIAILVFNFIIIKIYYLEEFIDFFLFRRFNFLRLFTDIKINLSLILRMQSLIEFLLILLNFLFL